MGNISFGFGSNCFLGMNWMLGGLEPLCLRKKESKASKRPQRPKNKENCSVEQEEKKGKSVVSKEVTPAGLS